MLNKSNSVNEDRKHNSSQIVKKMTKLIHIKTHVTYEKFPCCCLLLCNNTKNINDKDACNIHSDIFLTAFWKTLQSSYLAQSVIVILDLSCIKLSSSYDFAQYRLYIYTSSLALSLSHAFFVPLSDRHIKASFCVH